MVLSLVWDFSADDRVLQQRVCYAKFHLALVIRQDIRYRAACDGCSWPLMAIISAQLQSMVFLLNVFIAETSSVLSADLTWQRKMPVSNTELIYQSDSFIIGSVFCCFCLFRKLSNLFLRQ